MNSTTAYCHSSASLSKLNNLGVLYLDWKEVKSSNKYVIFNGRIIDMSLYLLNPTFLGKTTFDLFNSSIGQDITFKMAAKGKLQEAICLSDILTVAYIDDISFGCVVSDSILYVSLSLILGLVFIRFFVAIFFIYFVGNKLGARTGDFIPSVSISKDKRKFSRSSSLQSVQTLPDISKQNVNYNQSISGS